jgi:predicted RNA-binding protein with PUA-like domain
MFESEWRSAMAYWLLKTEPETFGWHHQVKKGDQGEPWTGVRNFRARSHLKNMRRGERAFFYHTGDEKRIVGIVEVIREAYPDPTDKERKFVCVDVKALEPVPNPVTLAACRAEPRLKDMVLIHQPRLSVQPVTDQEWAVVCQMGGVKAG